MKITALEFRFPVGTTAESGVCMGCGCRDDASCPGGCAWVDPAHLLCSVCLANALEAMPSGRVTAVRCLKAFKGEEFVALRVGLDKPRARKARRA